MRVAVARAVPLAPPANPPLDFEAPPGRTTRDPRPRRATASFPQCALPLRQRAPLQGVPRRPGIRRRRVRGARPVPARGARGAGRRAARARRRRSTAMRSRCRPTTSMRCTCWGSSATSAAIPRPRRNSSAARWPSSRATPRRTPTSASRSSRCSGPPRPWRPSTARSRCSRRSSRPSRIAATRWCASCATRRRSPRSKPRSPSHRRVPTSGAISAMRCSKRGVTRRRRSLSSGWWPWTPATTGRWARWRRHGCTVATGGTSTACGRGCSTLSARTGASSRPSRCWASPTRRPSSGSVPPSYAQESAVLPPLPARVPRAAARVRLGYLSSDFRDHAMGYLVADFLATHDRTRFEVVGFSHGPRSDGEARRRIERACDAFHDVRDLDDAGAAARMRERGIDIAIDLNGWTLGARPGVLARRPAPVQVQLPRVPGNDGRAVDRLCAGRRLHRAAGGRASLRRGRRAPARQLFRERPRPSASGRRPFAPRRPGCPTPASSSAASTTATRSRRATLRRLDAAARRGRGQRAVAARTTTTWRSPTSAREATRRGVDPDRLRVRAARAAGAPPRAPSAGRPLPRHAAVQRAHDGERRAVGGRAGDHLPRRDVRRAAWPRACSTPSTCRSSSPATSPTMKRSPSRSRTRSGAPRPAAPAPRRAPRAIAPVRHATLLPRAGARVRRHVGTRAAGRAAGVVRRSGEGAGGAIACERGVRAIASRSRWRNASIARRWCREGDSNPHGIATGGF